MGTWPGGVTYNGTANDYDDARALTLDNLGNVYVTGHSEGAGFTGQDYVTIKYVQSPGINDIDFANLEKRTFSPTIFRRPLQLPADKKCRVFDITGRVVDSSKIHPGIYFIEVDGVVTQKVVKVR
jgi:hypothetical protein